MSFTELVHDIKLVLNISPFMLWNGIPGYLVFVLFSVFVCQSACLSVCGKNFNLGHNFWTEEIDTSYLACILN